MPQVDALKKISVSIRLRDDPPPVGEHPARVDVTFICGIGREGITPFERRLAGRSVGDEIDLRVSAPEMGIFFEHLAPALAAWALAGALLKQWIKPQQDGQAGQQGSEFGQVRK